MAAAPSLAVVDLSRDTPSILAALHQGCSQGCFYVINHGIDKATIEGMFEQSAAFYTQPRHVREALAGREGVKSGWHASGSVRVHKDQKAGDTRELLRIALSDADVSKHPQGKDAPVRELLTGPAAAGLPIWPDAGLLPSFQPTMLAYFAAVNGLATRLIQYAAMALDLAPDAFLADDAAQATPAWQTLMLLHYPAQATDAAQGQFACGAHKDRFTQFTILANTPGSTGLEAQADDGSWYEVAPMEGAFIINVGSLLEVFSNGVFTAPLHRVVNPAGRERYSAPFYRGAAPDTVLRPMVPAPQGRGQREEYAPIKCADYMAGFAAAFKCPQGVSNAAAAAAAAAPGGAQQQTIAAGSAAA